MSKKVAIPAGFNRFTVPALKGYLVKKDDGTVWSAKTGVLREMTKERGKRYRVRMAPNSKMGYITDKQLQSAINSKAKQPAYMVVA